MFYFGHEYLKLRTYSMSHATKCKKKGKQLKISPKIYVASWSSFVSCNIKILLLKSLSIVNILCLRNQQTVKQIESNIQTRNVPQLWWDGEQ